MARTDPRRRAMHVREKDFVETAVEIGWKRQDAKRVFVRVLGAFPAGSRGYVTKGQLQELADDVNSRLPRMRKEGWDLLRVVSRLLNEAH